MTPGSIGLDIHAFLLTDEGRPNNLVLPPRTTRNVPTGLLIEPPSGRFLMVCSRSGLAAKSIIVMNAPGIIDPDYRGELRVLLFNGGYESFYIKHEDRIAQLIVMAALTADGEEVNELSRTERGELGFGSTGL
jgi:dUTP pyrophosphatase